MRGDAEMKGVCWVEAGLTEWLLDRRSPWGCGGRDGWRGGGWAGERKHWGDLWQPVNTVASQASQHLICCLCQEQIKLCFLKNCAPPISSLFLSSPQHQGFLSFPFPSPEHANKNPSKPLLWHLEISDCPFPFLQSVFRIPPCSPLVMSSQPTHTRVPLPAAPPPLYFFCGFLDWPEYLWRDSHRS